MRRAIGIGGATFVAVGAVLVLTLPASAHIHTDSASCVDGKSVLDISLTEYNGSIKNSVTITETDGNGKVTVLHDAKFGATFVQTFTEDGTITQSYHVVVTASDGAQFGFDHTDKTPACTEGGGSSSTTPPPTTTTAPPTHATTTSKPPTTTTAAPTTTTAVVAGVTTTGAGTLPFTGVNATFPLLIAGVLVIAGGGILLWLRLAARRRRTES
jgi:hypothetical protein